MKETPFYLWSINDALGAFSTVWTWLANVPVLGIVALALIVYVVVVAIITIGTEANQRA